MPASLLYPCAEINLLLVPTMPPTHEKCYKWGSGPSRHLALDLPVHVHKELDIGEDARCLVLYQKRSEEIACRSSNIHLIKRCGQGLKTTKVQ